MKAIIYTRVSTNKQGDSLDMQLNKCASFCELAGYEVIDTLIDEDVSGSVPVFQRKHGKRLLDKIKNKKSDLTHVICWKMDRMFRDTMDCLRTTDIMVRNNVNLCVVDMGGQPIDTSTPIGKVMLTMISAFSEFERNTIRDRVKKSLDYRKENMKVFNGTPPFGFDHKDGNMVRNNDYDVALEIIDKRKNNTLQSLADEYGYSVSKIRRILKNEKLYFI